MNPEEGGAFIDLVPAPSRRLVQDSLELMTENSNLLPVSILLDEGDNQTYLELRFGRCGDEEALVLIQDVTERRQSELSIQQSQKLESLGVLAGGVAHDFNNLLTGILGHAQLARDTLPENADSHRLLDVVESGAQRAAKLTSNLLAYAGEAHIELKPFNLTTLLQELHPLWSASLLGHQQLNIDLGHQSFWINGNESQVSQIVMNLVRNAAESITHDSGEVTLTLNTFRLEGRGLPDQVLQQDPRPGTYVCLSVQDNGCGLSPADRQKIFDPFFTSKGAGRGLGLAAVLGIVRHHGGTLTLKSVPEQGSLFQVYFQAAEAPVQEKAAPETKAGSGSRRMALVVDDDKDVRNFLCHGLKRMGVDTMQACDGQEAVEMVQNTENRLDIVFMDYAMPRMDGVRALGHFRTERPSLPVVMMSGFGKGEVLGDLDRFDHTMFLAKPFDLKSLKDIVKKVLNTQARAGRA